MGGAIPLSEDEARDCAEGTFNPRLFPLLWTFYERKVKLTDQRGAASRHACVQESDYLR
jgi:hypothetical protein